MSATAVSARLKVERARAHLAELDREIADFFAPEPLRIEDDVDAAGYRIARLIVKRQPPARCGAIVGDVVHNLRTALDYTAWQLVKANRQQPRRRTHFAICCSAKAFEKDGIPALRGMSDAAIETIRALQPLHAGGDAQRQPLALLERLDIQDKHRLLHVVGCAVSGMELAPTGALALEELHFNVPKRLLRSGDVLWRAKGSGGQLRMTTRFTVALNDHDQPLRETLLELFGVVDGALARLEPLLHAGTAL